MSKKKKKIQRNLTPIVPLGNIPDHSSSSTAIVSMHHLHLSSGAISSRSTTLQVENSHPETSPSHDFPESSADETDWNDDTRNDEGIGLQTEFEVEIPKKKRRSVSLPF